MDVAESTFRDNRRVVVPADQLYSVLEFLKAEHGFDMLVDITAVDYLEYADAPLHHDSSTNTLIRRYRDQRGGLA